MSDQKDPKTRVSPKKPSPRKDETVFAPPKAKLTPEKSEPGADATRYVSPARRQQRGPGDATLVNPHSPTVVAPRKEGARSRKKASPEAPHGLLKNRFMLQDVLGAGGMGVVYKAKDRLKVEAQDRDPYVAIKVLSDEFKSHPEAFIALQRESRKTQRIAHPNIVNVHDFDRDGDMVFMTMEFLDGKPLDKLLSQYRGVGLPKEDCLKVLEGICSALEYAHAENIVHADLKPGNIFVTHRGVPKVFDFGIARAVAKAERTDDNLEDKTVFDAGNLGALTPAYASLEMLEGSPPDRRDDIYALGCIAYEIFSGEHPFNRVHADDAARQKLRAKRIPGLNRYQWRAIESCLAFRREDRMASVSDFWKAFTHKRVATLKYAVGALVVLTSMAAAAYQYRAEWMPQFSEQEVRSEIEQQLRLEMQRESLLALLANATFTPRWEDNLWQSYRDLRETLGDSDVWMETQRSTVYQKYLDQIGERLADDDFEVAQRLLANAHRYTDDVAALQALEQQVAEAIERAKEEERRQAQAREAAQALAVEQQQKRAQQVKINHAFDTALATVDRQLACRQQLNMEDLTIAIRKLRELDAGRYRKQESRIVSNLASCIETIGSTFPDRAMVFKQQAMQLFPRSAQIAGIAIEPKDPCDPSLAGAGNRGPRASCRDAIAGVGTGPTLVVIPGFGGRPPYAIGQEEVNVADYNHFCRATGCEPLTRHGEQWPVTGVSFEQVERYASWLTEKTGYQYRLPTKEEWRHAASANGSPADPNRNCRFESRGIQRGGSLARAGVGQQNRWGLVNHLGNAREWVYAGGQAMAVGGSYDTPMDECTLGRETAHSGQADAHTGFRLVRELNLE
ncbi:bifunctional serine/threonine-protein kinase/formylglycine-generating enzyme family protein [Marinimicrobium agarilyticum]|uniref:bifunctional serine/threonine-protein kinase/formylglycine-generating enzyme family protein n=1 Tax=Marinimicrobium agarilyticum TaxID=306546 RepID=UPI0006875336|nr:bifunctional serine/threonine-protein kinase/formylglycine-generating enzyme family protein [Marinimicrobium agarilyticum]